MLVPIIILSMLLKAIVSAQAAVQVPLQRYTSPIQDLSTADNSLFDCPERNGSNITISMHPPYLVDFHFTFFCDSEITNEWEKIEPFPDDTPAECASDCGASNGQSVLCAGFTHEPTHSGDRFCYQSSEIIEPPLKHSPGNISGIFQSWTRPPIFGCPESDGTNVQIPVGEYFGNFTIYCDTGTDSSGAANSRTSNPSQCASSCTEDAIKGGRCKKFTWEPLDHAFDGFCYNYGTFKKVPGAVAGLLRNFYLPKV